MAGAPVATERDGAVAAVHLDRAEDRNALVPALTEPLLEQVAEWDADEAVRAIVVAGTDAVFASGGEPGVPGEGFWRRLRGCATPTVAAVSGFALGAGWELALACDLVVASERAEFGQPDIQLGMVPGGGAAQRLARTLGRQRAMELLLTARRITAQEALELGLVNAVTGRRDWFRRAVELAHVVASRPPVAARLVKRAVQAADELALLDGLAEERRLHDVTLATSDRVEAVQALAEKRRPEFEGR